MQGCRFARLTAAHSKSGKHHIAMQAIYFCFYKFSRKHETIKRTPAMVVAIVDRQWTVLELLERVV
jgi:hypothetical protein